MGNNKFALPLPMEGYGQPNSVSCWYACYAMMYVWNNKTVNELDQKLAAVFNDLTALKNRGLNDFEYCKIARAVGTRDVLRMSALNWSLEDIIDRLKRWGPIYISTKEYGGGHAMVVYGVDPEFGNIFVADPFTGRGNAYSAHTECFNLAKFRGTIQPVEFAVQVF